MPDAVFFDLYYGENSTEGKPKAGKQHIENLRLARSVLTQHYPDCAPLRELIGKSILLSDRLRSCADDGRSPTAQAQGLYKIRVAPWDHGRSITSGCPARLPEGTFARTNAVLQPKEKRSDLVREAVEREPARREAETSKSCPGAK
ncbi:hypothetical protein [Mesorhizobium silamurunense]|uniref:hypothetical protein n=1 Tax=Mesorhizobium silamurunense TaxID=499528 RepID=UPI001FEFC7BF|nr:hypothetical protein [Mesorhizobium silamurunense]